MSYIIKTGKAAKEHDEGGGSAKLFKLRKGEAVLVRLASDEDYAMYYAHSDHNRFYTTPCKNKAGVGEDLYCKAADMAYKDYFREVKRLKEEKGMSEKDAKKEAEELHRIAYRLKAKPRYLMAFIALDTGEPLYIDVTKKQGDNVISAIDKYAKRKDKIAFELEKTGESTSTTVTLSPVLDMEEDLTEKQMENFEATKGKTIDPDSFGTILSFRDEDGEIKDMKSFEDFDLERLGIEDKPQKEDTTPVDDADSDIDNM